MPLTQQHRRRIMGGAFHPLKLAPSHLYIAAPEYCFTDDGVTPATHGTTVKRWVNLGTAGGYREQTTEAARPTMTLLNGKYHLVFDGGDYFDNLASPTWTAGCFSAHSIAYTAAGYHNVFDGVTTQLSRVWIDPSSRIEFNGIVGPAKNDGLFHSVITHINPSTSSNRSRLWVNGALSIDSAFHAIDSTQVIALFNRAAGSQFQGKCSMMLFTSLQPTDQQVGQLAAWMAASVQN